MKKSKVFLNGIFDKNPLLVLGMGIPSAVIISQNVKASLTMGVCTLIVLLITVVLSHPFKKSFDGKVIFAMKVIIAACLTGIIGMFLNSFLPDISARLGVFVGIIGINAMILNVEEKEDTFVEAMVRALGQGISFVLIVVIMGVIRELLGEGTFWGIDIFNGRSTPMTIMAMAPGGLFILACLSGLINWFNENKKERL